MKYFAGLDVSLDETANCIVDEDGIIVLTRVQRWSALKAGNRSSCPEAEGSWWDEPRLVHHLASRPDDGARRNPPTTVRRLPLGGSDIRRDVSHAEAPDVAAN